MSVPNDLPTRETVRAALDVIAPEYSAFEILPLAGSYSNHTHLVNVEFANRPAQQIVLRRYNEANGDCEGKARREYHALKLLRGQQFPTPKPLLLDDTGALLGSAGIITEFVRGEANEASNQPKTWAENIDQVAQTLARIHQTAYDAATKRLLMNGNVEAAWFVKSGQVPAYMKQHPDGEMVWETVMGLLTNTPAAAPVLLHLDYWSGNILWHEGQISAVVDWEEASYGDPAIDVGYCRMEMYLEGLDEAAERFLQIYEREMGQPTANLGLWELAAVARPMTDLEGWLTRPMMDERFRRFIANAKRRTTA